MEDHEDYNTGLKLGLGIGGYYGPRLERQKEKSVVCLDLSFTLYPNPKAVNILDGKVHEGSSCKGGTEEDYKLGNVMNNDSTKDFGRKKLRLTREQSILLEESFKLHSALKPNQKKELAERLKLKPRQVEVWFQNRRARTKLKRTDKELEFLKKCCESLSEENRRLKRELEELRALRSGRQSYFQLPKATSLTICKSCEKKDTSQ
ncbi:hypothetical protein K2173_016682 [Erythroxylum novogranatense]|uniref:Homeobox domain-containing protein n=1 Tax=Erythroxylum novogranatense TaxID=1862640 RepID=A0AAV8SGW2_9ROSI|nr:hypothetical protein K2173_016682 [Erythroxylum novogranatense]